MDQYGLKLVTIVTIHVQSMDCIRAAWYACWKLYCGDIIPSGVLRKVSFSLPSLLSIHGVQGICPNSWFLVKGRVSGLWPHCFCWQSFQWTDACAETGCSQGRKWIGYQSHRNAKHRRWRKEGVCTQLYHDLLTHHATIPQFGPESQADEDENNKNKISCSSGDYLLTTRELCVSLMFSWFIHPFNGRYALSGFGNALMVTSAFTAMHCPLVMF